MTTKILFLFLGLSLSFAGLSQSTKRVKKFKIKELIEYYSDSESKPIVQKVKRFDAKGNLVFLEEYSKKGVLKKKEEYTFDRQKRITKKCVFDDKKEVTECISYTYQLDEVILSEHVLSGNKSAHFTIEYQYNGFNEKVKEVKKDETGKILKTIEYKYDNKGLRTQKTERNGDGAITEIKEYHYQFGK